MPQSPNNKVVTPTGVVFQSAGASPLNPLAGVAVVATGTATNNAKVSGQVPNSSILIANPA